MNGDNPLDWFRTEHGQAIRIDGKLVALGEQVSDPFDPDLFRVALPFPAESDTQVIGSGALIHTPGKGIFLYNLTVLGDGSIVGHPSPLPIGGHAEIRYYLMYSA